MQTPYGDDEEHERVLQRAAAVDVAMASGMVCVRVPHPSDPGRRLTRTWSVSSTSKAVRALAEELAEARVERVVLEATSDYWRRLVGEGRPAHDPVGHAESRRADRQGQPLPEAHARAGSGGRWPRRHLPRRALPPPGSAAASCALRWRSRARSSSSSGTCSTTLPHAFLTSAPTSTSDTSTRTAVPATSSASSALSASR